MTRSRGRLFHYLSAIFFFFLFSFAVNAQAPGDPTLSQGLKAYGSYSGGDIDVVSFENGKLDLHIPLLSYPQRGKLQMSFTIRYNNPGYTLNKVCLPLKPPPPCTYNVSANFTRPGPWGVSVVADFSALSLLPTGVWNPANDTYSGNGDYPIIYMPDGSSHPTGNITGTANYRATDASGWMVNSTAQNFVPGTITAPDGTRYSINGSGQQSMVEDTNGNQITTNSSPGWTDSLGRSIPVPPTPTSGVAGNLSSCPSGLLTVVTAYAWNVPAPSGGTDPYTFCYVNLSVDVKVGSFSPTTPFQLTPVMLQSIVLPNGQSWSFSYDGAADLAQITLPTGGTISYSNSLLQMCVVGGAFPQNFLSAVVSRTVNANDGTGPHIWSYGGSLGGSVLARTVTDPAGNQEVHTLTGLVAGGYATCRYYETQLKKYQGSSSSGTLLQTITTSYSYNADPYAQPNPGALSAASVVNVVPISITTAWANGQTSQVTKTYDSGFTYFSTWTGLYGKVMSESDFDYASGAPGPLLRRTVNNYQAFANSNYLTYNILDPLYTVAVYDNSANKCKGVATYCAYTYFGYDEGTLQSSGITTQHDPSPVNKPYRGNQTSTHRWLNGSTVAQNNCNAVSTGYLVLNEVFFDTGEVQSSSDACGYSSSFLYSPTYAGAFPTTITNSLGQQTVNTYDPNTGLLTGTTDPNQQLTSYGYDSSLRLTSASYPDGGLTSYSYNDSIPASVTVTKAINSSLKLVKTAVLDGLARVSQTQLVDPDCNSTTGLVYVNYGYGYNSSTTSTTGAYTTVSNSYCQTSDTTYGVTTENEDALGRVASVVEADGTHSQVVTTYSGNCTTVTDEVRNARQSCVDGLGRMTSVLEDPGTSPHLNYQTLYQYDALNNLTTVTQNGSNSGSARTRNFAYDSLFHLTSATNPESGAVSYAYDADGNVVTKTAPKPNQTGTSTIQTSYSYDKLNRLSQKSYNDGITPAVQYGYDATALSGCTPGPPSETDTYPVGRRTAMCDGSGATSWKHDQMGRVLQERRTIGTVLGDYETDAYNLDGAPTSITSLGYSITYTYSAAERPITATNYTGGTTKFVTGATYAPPGELATMTLGSTSGFTGIVTNNAYNARLQPILLSAAVAGQNPVFSLCFDFHVGLAVTGPAPCSFSASTLGDNGNVYQVWNNRDNTRNESFTYDSLNRVCSAESNGTHWGETFTIDAWGNLTNEAGIAGKTNHEGLSTSAGTNNQLSGFGYDAAGNMTSNGSASYVYDAENRLIATGGNSYIYDGDGQRVEKCTEGAPGACASGATGTLYWRGTASDALSETDLSGNVQNIYVFFDGSESRDATVPKRSTIISAII